ncbi:MAG: hypothetical protein IKU07_02405, partial [Oscillospiraceae bacterium]|nr:hypothetical protein [Oscillospiraceae bacterium]
GMIFSFSANGILLSNVKSIAKQAAAALLPAPYRRTRCMIARLISLIVSLCPGLPTWRFFVYYTTFSPDCILLFFSFIRQK